MIRNIHLLLGVAAMVSVPAHADLSDSRSLLCAPASYWECDATGCARVESTHINAPDFMVIDVRRKRIESLDEDNEVVSELDHLETVDGKLIVQGVEDGRADVRDGLGYSLAVSLDTGEMVLSAASEGVSFSAFGKCIEAP